MPPLIRWLTATHPRLNDLAVLLLRLSVGAILFATGAGKVFGWFGGQGLAATIEVFVTRMGVAAPLAYLSCFTELIGGALLLVGLLTRPAAVAVAINMTVATAMTLPLGFLARAAFPFSLLVATVAILLTGPRAWSLDARLPGAEREKAAIPAAEEPQPTGRGR